MQSDVGKAKILTAINNHLKPGGKFLSHEMVICHNEAVVRHDLAQTIRVNANPLTLEAWSKVCQDSGLTIQQQQIGIMGLLNLSQMIRDEGLLRTVKIAGNILINPNLRHRVLQMRRNFQQQRNNIGYIVFISQREAEANFT